MNKKQTKVSSCILKLRKLQWECIKRNTEYKKLVFGDDYNYLINNSIIKRYWIQERPCEDPVDLFNLLEKAFGKENATESMGKTEKSNEAQNENMASSDSKEENSLAIFLDCGPAFEPDIETLKESIEGLNTSDDNEVLLLIDLSYTKERILNKVEALVDSAQKKAKRKTNKRVRKSRVHLGKIPTYLKIWDLKEKGKTNEEIAKIAFKDEWEKIISAEYQDVGIISKNAFEDNKNIIQRLLNEKIIKVDNGSHDCFCFGDYIADEEQLEKLLNSTGFQGDEKKLILNIWRKFMNAEISDNCYDEKNKLIQRVKDEYKAAKELINGGYKDLR